MKRIIGRTPPPDGANAERRQLRTFWLREGLILGGFLLLVAAAVFTVAIPELRKEPEGRAAAGSAGAGVGSAGDGASGAGNPAPPAP